MDSIDKHHMPGENIIDYTIIKIIGEGRYGIAYLCEKNTNERQRRGGKMYPFECSVPKNSKER